jgi:phospholipase C
MALDHTSILKTVEQRWNLPALTARDAAAPSVAAVLTLKTPRTDDPLQGVTVPQAKGSNPSAHKPSHLQKVLADLVSRLPVPDAKGGTHHQMPALHTTSDYRTYIQERTAAWKAARKVHPVHKKKTVN